MSATTPSSDNETELHALESLASGELPERFPYKFRSSTDAASPFSLVLAFYPEVKALPELEFNATHEAELPEAIASYVQKQCDTWGWTADALESDSSSAAFIKTWLRMTDEKFRRLDTVPHLREADTAWIDGVVRVLQLWRKFERSTEPALKQFEGQSPESVFDELIDLRPPGWSLRQRLEFLILPYCRYKNRVDLLETWISGAELLEDVADAVFAPELASGLLQLCLSTLSGEWRRVQHVITNMRPVHNTEESETKVGGTATNTVTWESLFMPTKATLNFFAALVETAKTSRFQASTFQQLAEWTLGDAATQVDLLVRCLAENSHFGHQDLETLQKTVFSKIDASTFVTEVIRTALASSRFMFLKFYVNSVHADILKAEVKQMVDRYGTPEGSDLTLSRVLSALELVDIGPEVRAKFERLQQLQSTFGIDPVFALTHAPLDLVRYALEHGSQVYLRFSPLQNIVAGSENGANVAELCVEAALADDNFEAACELIDRKFVKETSSGAWLALYEVGKFLSPQWDLPRPLPVLQKQQQYLSRSLSLCPEDDVLGVLRAWSVLEEEQIEAQKAALVRDEAPAASIIAQTADTSTEAAGERSNAGPRDHLSSLLVSGLGWAIGANQ